MRDAFLERLYRHRVADARIAPLLSELDGVRDSATDDRPSRDTRLPISGSMQASVLRKLRAQLGQ